MNTKRYVGQVTRYGGTDGKPFGFILATDENGNEGEVFFHLNDYRAPLMGEDGGIHFNRFGRRAPRAPVVGDRITFEAVWGDRGCRASPWAFAEDYERLEARVKQVIAAKSIVYRVIERYDVSGNKGKDTVKFEGDITDLNHTLPKPYNRRIDELSTGFSCGDFDHHIHFERKEGEEWVVCDDPRTQVDEGQYRRLKRGY